MKLFLPILFIGLFLSIDAQAQRRPRPRNLIYVIQDMERGSREYYPSYRMAQKSAEAHNRNWGRYVVRVVGTISHAINPNTEQFVIVDTYRGTQEFHYSLAEAYKAVNGHNANYSRNGDYSNPIQLRYGITFNGFRYPIEKYFRPIDQ